MSRYRRAAITLFQGCRRLAVFGQLHSELIMRTLQRIEQWRSARVSPIELASSQHSGEPPSLHKGNGTPLETEAIGLTLEDMPCASPQTIDSDEQSESGDIDWLQREREIDPIQIQRREYGNKKTSCWPGLGLGIMVLVRALSTKLMPRQTNGDAW
jgi:hypothetical protein